MRSLEVNDQNQLLTVKTCTASRLYQAFYLRKSAFISDSFLSSLRVCFAVQIRVHSWSFFAFRVRLHLCSDLEPHWLNRKFFDERRLHRSQYLLSGRAGKSDPKIGAGMSGN